MFDRCLPLLCCSVLVARAHAQTAEKPPKEYGHSSHGEAYDEGPRQRPWRIEGVGYTPFTVTTKVPEVQQWFDQGNALLHSFWYYEAERAFRWCVKLDPGCAMAYWGLARSVPRDRERFDAFLKQAVARKHLCSERERRYIEAWDNAFSANLDRVEPPRLGWNATSPELAEELEKIILDYPDDIEAKSLYVLSSMFKAGRYGLEAVLQQVLAKAPEHPGAHHYRIHNWDTIELGHYALDSCAAYGRVAPAVGHANHMPGHIYTKLGMWHEGAIWLDSATRVEKAYMQQRLIFPFNNWNYAHNRNFLAYAQSILGLPNAALQGARDLLNAPLDPDRNKDDGGYSVFRQGMSALRRTLVRFERWEEILKQDSIPWRDTPGDAMWRAYCEGLAHLGLGRLDEAEEKTLALRRMVKEKKIDKELHGLMAGELEGLLRVAKGETIAGLNLLQKTAAKELERREHDNDPPTYPRCVYNVLGETLLDLGSPKLAVPAFEKALEVMKNNPFSLSGLARAWHVLGDRETAAHAYARMLSSWSHAEPGIRQNERARALGLDADPIDTSPAPQRSYLELTLESLGPNTWQPYMAPALDALTAARERVTLEQYRGKNVLLIFYLSDQCLHCVEQLDAMKEKIKDFEERDTVILAISADPPEKNAKGKVGRLPFVVLSDGPGHRNAIRFKSYDEFEGIELHSTNLIDRKGRMRWARTGGDPFMKIDFLLKEIDRIEAIDKSGRLAPVVQR